MSSGTHGTSQWHRPPLAGVLGVLIAGATCLVNLSVPYGWWQVRGLVFWVAITGSSAAIWLAFWFALGAARPRMGRLKKAAVALGSYVIAGFLFVGGLRLFLPYFMGGAFSWVDLLLILTWPVWISWFGYFAVGVYCLPFN